MQSGDTTLSRALGSSPIVDRPVLRLPILTHDPLELAGGDPAIELRLDLVSELLPGEVLEQVGRHVIDQAIAAEAKRDL